MNTRGRPGILAPTYQELQVDRSETLETSLTCSTHSSSEAGTGSMVAAPMSRRCAMQSAIQSTCCSIARIKSDYALSPLGSAGIDAMMAAVAPVVAGGIVLLCDSYGGKISDVAADATAFPRRAGTQYCIQYFSSWTRAGDTPTRLAQVAKVYAAMRPHMPGASYVNYCDLASPDF